ncbi:uncharacterized protein KZ484_014001 [Pholidichthys leucotaenia]
MAMVVAELRLRSGQVSRVQVQVNAHLRSLITGITEMNVKVSQLLNELVEREKQGACVRGEEEEDEDEDEEEDGGQNCHRPPTKRPRNT